MKERFRASMAWLHTWTGLVVGWVLFFMFLTGTAGYFHDEITRWMRPEQPLQGKAAGESTVTIPPTRGFALTQAFLRQHAAGADSWGMDVPHQGHTDLSVWWVMPEEQNAEGSQGSRGSAVLDPETGARKEEAAPMERATGGGFALYRMHYNLHYMPFLWARYIVGFSAMVMLVALITGIITHRRFFVDFFTFRPGKGAGSWMDGHAVLGVIALPFLLMITYSGLVFFLFTYMPAGLRTHFANDFNQMHEALHGHEHEHEHDHENESRSGVTLEVPSLAEFIAKAAPHWPNSQVTGIRVDFPGDQNAVINLFRHDEAAKTHGQILSFHASTGLLVGEADDNHEHEEEDHGFAHEAQEVLYALHTGEFSGKWVRWLYFGSGLLGCALIATGLILWTVKRRAKNARQSASFGQQLVERLNIGTIAGLPAGFAVYFWANRLLPVTMPERGEWELHALFITWAVLLVYPAFRPVLKGWREELALAGLLFALLPVLNFFTTERHLGRTLPAGDWELASFDLTVLVLGLLFFQASRRVARSLHTAPVRRAAALPAAMAVKGGAL